MSVCQYTHGDVLLGMTCWLKITMRKNDFNLKTWMWKSCWCQKRWSEKLLIFWELMHKHLWFTVNDDPKNGKFPVSRHQEEKLKAWWGWGCWFEMMGCSVPTGNMWNLESGGLQLTTLCTEQRTGSGAFTSLTLTIMKHQQIGNRCQVLISATTFSWCFIRPLSNQVSH